MRYDPATQAALTNPAAWIVLLLLLGALVMVSLVIFVSLLALAGRSRLLLWRRLMAASGWPQWR